MRKVIVLLIFAAACGYLYLPYRAVERLNDAMNQSDKTELALLLDQPAAASSLKRDMKAALFVEVARRQAERSISAQLPIESLFKPIDTMVDTVITPEAIIRLNEMAKKARLPDDGDMKPSGWRSATLFVAAAEKNDESRCVFEFQGLKGWRVVSFEMPQNKMEEDARNILERAFPTRR